jgi:predicted peroxiredoxin
LRLAGLGVGGLGLTALAGGPPKAVAAEGASRGYVVTVTHGPGNATRVMLALVTAGMLPRGDNHVWFAIDGGALCKKGEAEKVTSPLFPRQGSVAKMLDRIRARGTAVHI